MTASVHHEHTLRLTDAFGNTSTTTVVWMEEDASWTDPAFENVGLDLTAFGADNCPAVPAWDHATNCQVPEPLPVQINGVVFTPTEVTSRADLFPGAFFLEER